MHKWRRSQIFFCFRLIVLVFYSITKYKDAMDCISGNCCSFAYDGENRKSVREKSCPYFRKVYESFNSGS